MIRQIFYIFLDIPLRVRNKLLRKLNYLGEFSKSNWASDSQSTFYEKSVSCIISSNRKLKRFRRIYNYREILEHLTYADGLDYLDRLNELKPDWNFCLDQFKENDKFGKPRTYVYGKFGKFSPTTLRYIAVAYEIDRLVDLRKVSKIVEIGGGYGGQSAILRRITEIEDYQIYDLPNVQLLIEAYLKNVDCTPALFPRFPPDANSSKSIDLVISNYAFSELPRDVQQIYLDRVIKYARNGYLLMNSGLGNSTGRSDGKLRLEEIKAAVPNLVVAPEIPKTGEDNYLLYWTNESNG